MTFFKRLAGYWQNTQSMPLLLRLLSQGTMVAAPILLLFLLLPIMEWDINGHRVTYTELWHSGQGVAIASSLAFAAAGAWGLAARNSASRWLLVLTPVVPYLALVILPATSSKAFTHGGIASAVFTTVVFYFCLFHLRGVRAYLYSTA
jgi:hypothetical protein